jgi:hypothetical protein
MGGKTADEPTWYASKRCDTGQCVEIGTVGDSILIRSSTDPTEPHVTLSRREWDVFVAGVKDGDFDSV